MNDQLYGAVAAPTGTYILGDVGLVILYVLFFLVNLDLLLPNAAHQKFKSNTGKLVVDPLLRNGPHIKEKAWWSCWMNCPRPQVNVMEHLLPFAPHRATWGDSSASPREGEAAHLPLCKSQIYILFKHSVSVTIQGLNTHDTTVQLITSSIFINSLKCNNHTYKVLQCIKQSKGTPNTCLWYINQVYSCNPIIIQNLPRLQIHK